MLLGGDEKKLGKNGALLSSTFAAANISVCAFFCHKKWSVFTDLSSAAASNQFSISLFSR